MRQRWLYRLGQALREENWLAISLLLVTFTIFILGVTSATTGLEFRLIWPIVILGLVFGWGSAASSATAKWMVVISLLLGPILTMIQVGNLLSLLAALIVSLYEHLNQTFLLQGIPSDESLTSIWHEVTLTIITLVNRTVDWLLALAGGNPIFDPVASAILWLLVLWLVSVWAGWFVRRWNRPLLALFPSLLLLASLITITGGSFFYLLPAMALILVQKANMSHTVRERTWKADDIGFSARYGRNITWTVLGLTLALMFVASILPSPSIYDLVDTIRDLRRQQPNQDLARSLGLEERPRAQPVDAFAKERLGGLPARHLIGSGPELSQQPIMTVQWEGSAPLTDGLRYWRGVTYDRYTGHGWESSRTTTVAYEAGEAAGRILDNQQIVRQEVQPLTDLGGLYYAAGLLTTIDEPFQVAWRARFPDTNTYTDYFAAATIAGETGSYRVDSFVPIFNEEALRTAEQEIPAYIADHFLILPDDVSDRVRALARDLTAAEATPYDRALAIEEYLRQFPYTLDLPAPPSDREIADYFLFELQRGYCDYYATTMVVLARASGLPARLVTGFVGGAFDGEESRYTITADLAHSWPEIYFTGYGWIPFEPTGGRGPIERSEAEQPQLETTTDRELEPIMAARQRARWNLLLGVAVGSTLLFVALILGWWILDVWRLRRLTPNKALGRVYKRLNRGGRWLYVQPELGETPHEFSQKLGARLAQLSSMSLSRSSSVSEEINWLTDLYMRTLLSPYKPQAQQHVQAVQTWSRLRIHLLWAALLLRMNRTLVWLRIK